MQIEIVSLLQTSLSLILLMMGTVLMILEAFAPGAHFVVVGVALFGAGLVGTLASAFFVSLPIPALAVLVLLFGLIAFYGYNNLSLNDSTGQTQTSSADSLRSKEGVVTERVTTQSGEVKVDNGGFNPYYSARTLQSGDEIEEGERVIVVEPQGGNVVRVVPVNGTDEIDRELEELSNISNEIQETDETRVETMNTIEETEE